MSDEPDPRGGPAGQTDEDLVPRPSKMRYVAIFFAGILVGRIASQNFAPGPLGAIDLFMYVGLAITIAWAWRSWARRAMIQRHLDAERRRARSGPTTPTAPPETPSDGPSEDSESPATARPRPARRRRRR